LLREIPRKEKGRIGLKGRSKRKPGNLNRFDMSDPQFHAVSAVGGVVTSFETLRLEAQTEEEQN
jgi:hypothetical protein